MPQLRSSKSGHSHKKKRGSQINENEPPKGCYIENERAQINKWCKLAKGVKKKRIVNGRKTRLWCTLMV